MDLLEVVEGNELVVISVGYDWFVVLIGMKNLVFFISIVYYGKLSKFIEEVIVILIVFDFKNLMYCVWNGEVGLVEGFCMG